MEYTYQDHTIIYSIVYEKRKKTVLTIDPSGFVKLKAPKGTDEAALVAILEEKAPWIAAHLDKIKQRANVFEQPQPKRFLEGESFLYMGKAYPIEVQEDPSLEKSNVGFNGKVLSIALPCADEAGIRNALQRFYTRECRQVILKRIAFYQSQFKVKPSLVEIKEMATKWGQCSSDRKLVFNWKLIMAPLEVLDYIVVHEMCHLVHMNHDRSFWRLVGKILPDHEARTRWLTLNGSEMSF